METEVQKMFRADLSRLTDKDMRRAARKMNRKRLRAARQNESRLA